tara:strand:+ start:197 stop:598 length:402 start_codon:yes stop_codon:yes gene_type:complete
MIYYNKPKNGYRNLSVQQTKELEEVFSSGYCWVLALTLNRMFGYPISAVLDDMIVEHAWVTLPNGKDLDILGVSENCWSKPTHTNMTEEQFIENSEDGSCFVPEGTKLGLCEEEFKHCKQVVEEYLLPTYGFA